MFIGSGLGVCAYKSVFNTKTYITTLTHWRLIEKTLSWGFCYPSELPITSATMAKARITTPAEATIILSYHNKKKQEQKKKAKITIEATTAYFICLVIIYNIRESYGVVQLIVQIKWNLWMKLDKKVILLLFLKNSDNSRFISSSFWWIDHFNWCLMWAFFL